MSDGSAGHTHVRFDLVAMPIPQPHRARGWRCWCGAIEFDTYPVSPDGADDRRPPIGSAWVERQSLERVIGATYTPPAAAERPPAERDASERPVARPVAPAQA